MARTLWGIGSSRALRAHWALAELGLDYEIEPIRTRTPEMESDRYLAVNPRGKIPTLVDGDFTLYESAAIVTYLGTSYGLAAGVELVPSDPQRRARYDEWCYYIKTELDATSLYIIRRHGELPEIYGEAPVAVTGAAAYFDRMAAAVDRTLADGRPFLLEAGFSGADILLTTCLTWALRCGISLSEPAQAYRTRATARPAYLAAHALCYPDV